MFKMFKPKSKNESKPEIKIVPGEAFKKEHLGETSVDAKYNTVIPIRQSQNDTSEIILTRIEKKLTELEGKPCLNRKVRR